MCGEQYGQLPSPIPPNNECTGVKHILVKPDDSVEVQVIGWFIQHKEGRFHEESPGTQNIQKHEAREMTMAGH